MRSRHVALVAIGGAFGAITRHLLTDGYPTRSGTFPWTTFWINVAGAFTLGVVLELVVRFRPHDTWERFFVGIGLIGAFTTFSTLSTETVLLAREGRAVLAGVYLSSSVIAGLASTFLGLVAAGWRAATTPPDEGES
jgi:CrcB protein